jgi:hypothetical protein
LGGLDFETVETESDQEGAKSKARLLHSNAREYDKYSSPHALMAERIEPSSGNLGIFSKPPCPEELAGLASGRISPSKSCPQLPNRNPREKLGSLRNRLTPLVGTLKRRDTGA